MTLRTRLAATLQRAAHRIAGQHVYLSTGCLHGTQRLPDGRTGHEYCQAMTGHAGTKRPGECKVCSTRCICTCHETPRGRS
ncbi:hypothetical protein RB200_19615 [Streptomyces sp. PmtG]